MRVFKVIKGEKREMKKLSKKDLLNVPARSILIGLVFTFLFFDRLNRVPVSQFLFECLFAPILLVICLILIISLIFTVFFVLKRK